MSLLPVNTKSMKYTCGIEGSKKGSCLPPLIHCTVLCNELTDYPNEILCNSQSITSRSQCVTLQLQTGSTFHTVSSIDISTMTSFLSRAERNKSWYCQ